MHCSESTGASETHSCSDNSTTISMELSFVLPGHHGMASNTSNISCSNESQQIVCITYIANVGRAKILSEHGALHDNRHQQGT